GPESGAGGSPTTMGGFEREGSSPSSSKLDLLGWNTGCGTGRDRGPEWATTASAWSGRRGHPLPNGPGAFLPGAVSRWRGGDTEMRTGEVQANLLQLDEDFRLPYIPELIERKITGSEKGCLGKGDAQFHQREYERLRSELEQAFKVSSLPEAPKGAAA